jgi:guanine deaminase
MVLVERNEMATTTTKKLFLGSFVHSKALDKLEYLHNTAVFVDESGTIAAVEQECNETKAKETVLPRLGWDQADVEVVTAEDGQFFFPGFIGEWYLGLNYSRTCVN